jgi:tartrate dehydratase alpha subunit/fumarate hydratase class I-like protein
VLQILKDNAELARTKEIPYCRDTTTATAATFTKTA